MAFDIKGNLDRNKSFWMFVGAALVVAVALGVFVSPFASSSLDGLEKKAHDKGFLEKAEETKPAWNHSPMKDYAVAGIENEKVSTGVSGLFGVLITVVVAISLGLFLRGLGRTRAEKKDLPSEA